MVEQIIWYEPNMTSNNTPAPFVASAGGTGGTGLSPYNAFDGIVGNGLKRWRSESGVVEEWVQLDFGVVTLIDSFRINVDSTPTLSPKDFTLKGSLNGVDFNDIYKVENKTSYNNGYNEFLLDKTYNYRYYRLEITSGNGTNYVSIDELSFGYNPKVKNTLLKSNNKIYSLKSEELTQIPSSSIDNFISYGSSSIDNFNVINTSKNYILCKNDSQNQDGLLVTQINRKPLSIKIN